MLLRRRSLLAGGLPLWLGLGVGVGAHRARAADFGAAGDRVTCPNRHPIARLRRSLYAGDTLPLSTFCNWRITPPKSLDPAPPCPICNKQWYQAARRGGLPAVYVDAKGWLPYDPSNGRTAL